MQQMNSVTQLTIVDVLNGASEVNAVSLTHRKMLLGFVLGQTCAIKASMNKMDIGNILSIINTKFPIDVTSIKVIANQAFDLYTMLTSGDRELLLDREASPFLLYTYMPHIDIFNILADYAKRNNPLEISALREIFRAYVNEIKSYSPEE